MHIMIDLETLGTNPLTAPIIQIAAVAFNLGVDHPATIPHYDARIDARSCLRPPLNRAINVDTVAWWAKTDPALLVEIMESATRMPLQQGLGGLSAWTSGMDIEGVWSNGATFDITMLEMAYDQANMHTPWPFRAVRDVRTMAMIAGDDPVCWDGGPKTEREAIGKKHDAVVDCLRQVRMVQQTWLHRVKHGHYA